MDAVGSYTVIAVILIAIHLIAGYVGALVGAAIVKRNTGAKPSALAVLACGIAGALVAIAIVLAAFPYFLGLVCAPVFGGLAVFLLNNLQKR